MPDGVSLGTIAAVLIPVGIVTVLLRELPFSAKKWMKDSEFFSLLGLMMPVGVMTILVVYAVAGQADGTGGLWPVLLGVLVTAGLHKWKRDSGLSIFGGTAFYMLLVNVVL
ncbi:branched-chain amino acid transporter permease [Corynebacterium accolens]|jgi:integral membrane amino acid transport protein|uniref:branched-chain amino acid transporter permease n=1 Tax=Corynebacterium accolens TaxID=38284 RepID=UPI001EDC1B8B|nr:AzlD domain-containing protein [Corynebacterium accolens]MDK4267129.1 AzlD domain-containing protein [Corynebacterium accolens]MDK4312057.1 AzlD domain-containing protein [Corynebacterium accolens]MDK8470067.1 AzlD domain-containing protein [Corynebacterium accolens]MDK8498807.1 AzlD domain-containing protein [Corynebacterium accolens]MDK8593817.1 AzlD domain-containing protein [Corynebacterium accolens]